jgi:hypothetical protein
MTLYESLLDSVFKKLVFVNLKITNSTIQGICVPMETLGKLERKKPKTKTKQQ